MIEINLVPDIKKEFIKAQKIRATVVTFSIMICVVSISIVALLAIYIFAVQAVRGGLVDSAIDTESRKLIAIPDLSKTVTIQNQLTKISNLNANKNISSRLFDVLKVIIPPAPNNIQISNLVVDTDLKTINIDGQAANSYAALEVFKKTINGAILKFTDVNNVKQEIVLASNINTANTSYGEDASGKKVLRFTISFGYIDQLFLPSSKDVSVSVPNIGNVTDSYLGVPQSIFVNPAKDIEGGQ
jgi:hypothetical protein